MTDSTNQMLAALSKLQLEKSLAEDAAAKQLDYPELNLNPAPDMAKVLANCFSPDGNEPTPQK